ncbi:hypothetical protein B0H10DRAFT_248429 [Mycena sp. CBHHK59/15]|nr:hypothetical protein B0H10DRAFT_368850 [Mycena sp. CBHHK59/15]KAJ6613203.1 hypothetical protein B0H10DRAFT_248429 [Mycena sp. CBHHK59/15]
MSSQLPRFSSLSALHVACGRLWLFPCSVNAASLTAVCRMVSCAMSCISAACGNFFSVGYRLVLCIEPNLYPVRSTRLCYVTHESTRVGQIILISYYCAMVCVDIASRRIPFNTHAELDSQPSPRRPFGQCRGHAFLVVGTRLTYRFYLCC